MASGGGASAKGGSFKGTQSSGTVAFTKEKKANRKATKDQIDDCIMTLRAAIFEANGKDKDVTNGVAPLFMSFKKNGLDLTFQFSTKLQRRELDWAFELTKEHMEDVYDASGYGWDDEDKRKELSEQGTRFILVRESTPEADGKPGRLVAFCHFRFTVQGEVIDSMTGGPCLFLWDIQIEREAQGCGLAKHLLMLLELISRRENMGSISVPVQLGHSSAMAWIQKCRGFAPDEELYALAGFDPEMEGFAIYSKYFSAPVTKAAAPAVTAPVAASTPPSSVTPMKKEGSDKTEVVMESPSGVADLVTEPPSPPSATEEAAAAEEGEGDEEIDLSKLDEHDVINGMKVMFREKNGGAEPTDEMVDQWVVAVRGAKLDWGSCSGKDGKEKQDHLSTDLTDLAALSMTSEE